MTVGLLVTISVPLNTKLPASVKLVTVRLKPFRVMVAPELTVKVETLTVAVEIGM